MVVGGGDKMSAGKKIEKIGFLLLLNQKIHVTAIRTTQVSFDPQPIDAHIHGPSMAWVLSQWKLIKQQSIQKKY